MQEILRFIEPPRTCSYLPEETASLETRVVLDMTPAEYSDLLSRGYRRFGSYLFRPACSNCRQCRSLRVRAREFIPSASERRILAKNKNIRVELHPLFATGEHVALYNLYHRFMHWHRGWPLQQSTFESYGSGFLSGATNLGRQWLYFENGRLVGVALMDQALNAISLVYFFYDPGWRARSPGIFSILNQILYAKTLDLEYAYLGYWIEACQSMNYKGRFRPREILTLYPSQEALPVWQ